MFLITYKKRSLLSGKRLELILCFLVVVIMANASTKSIVVRFLLVFHKIKIKTKISTCSPNPKESLTEPEILAILEPMIRHYAKERHPGEHFGDFTIRAGYIAPTTEGKEWYDRSGGEGIYRETAAIVAV